MSNHRRLDEKMWCICTVEAHSAKTKNEIVPFAATGMDVQGIMLSDMSQPKKDQYCIIALKYGMWTIQQKSEYNTKAPDSDTEN